MDNSGMMEELRRINLIVYNYINNVFIPPEREKFQQYEEHKRVIGGLCSTCGQFDLAIRCLTSRLGI